MTYRLGYDFRVIIFYPNVQIIFPLWRDDKYSQLASLEGLLLLAAPSPLMGDRSSLWYILRSANGEWGRSLPTVSFQLLSQGQWQRALHPYSIRSEVGNPGCFPLILCYIPWCFQLYHFLWLAGGKCGCGCREKSHDLHPTQVAPASPAQYKQVWTVPFPKRKNALFNLLPLKFQTQKRKNELMSKL